MSAVRDRLRDQPLPGEAEAAARSWPVVEAALAERLPAESRAATRPRNLAFRIALVAGLLGAGLAAALSPAGAAVGDWIGDRFDGHEERSTPALAGLPEGGSVLAISRSGAYAVRPDGGTRFLGAFSEVGWSPHGLHVIGVQGRRLIAVTPAGTRKWTLVARRAVHHPAWSLGDGFVVAYLEGSSLRTVDGKGNPDTRRVLRRAAAAVTPAWRPGPGHVLTYVTTTGSAATVDADSGQTLWSARLGLPDTRALAWSRDGRRLAALSSDSVTVVGRAGHVLRTVALPGVGRELALHPSGRRAAVVVTGGGETRVLEIALAGRGPRAAGGSAGGAPRQLFQGDVDGLAWSADGRHLLLAWRDTGEWLVFGPRGRKRALHGVSRELGAAGGFPRVAGWCCPG